MFFWDQPFAVDNLVGYFRVLLGETPFSVRYINFFYSASNQVSACLITPRDCSYRVSTENGWKRITLRNVNSMNPNQLRLMSALN